MWTFPCCGMPPAAELARFWRSLDELADTPEFRNHMENEFPHGAE